MHFTPNDIEKRRFPGKKKMLIAIVMTIGVFGALIAAALLIPNKAAAPVLQGWPSESSSTVEAR